MFKSIIYVRAALLDATSVIRIKHAKLVIVTPISLMMEWEAVNATHGTFWTIQRQLVKYAWLGV